VSNGLALKRKWWVGRWKMALRGKVQKPDFPTSLGNPAKAAGFPLLPPPRRLRAILTNDKNHCDRRCRPIWPYDEAISSFDCGGVGGLIQTAVGWGGCFGRAWVNRSGLRA